MALVHVSEQSGQPADETAYVMFVRVPVGEEPTVGLAKPLDLTSAEADAMEDVINKYAELSTLPAVPMRRDVVGGRPATRQASARTPQRTAAPSLPPGPGDPQSPEEVQALSKNRKGAFFHKVRVWANGPAGQAAGVAVLADRGRVPEGTLKAYFKAHQFAEKAADKPAVPPATFTPAKAG